MDLINKESELMFHINSFVKRQTPDSEFSHFDGNWNELLQMVEEFYPNYKEGYRDGVVLFVEIVLYHSHVLKEDGENEIDDGWEVISINANPVEGEMPIPVGALIANHFKLSGGTDSQMTDEEFMKQLKESVIFWKDKSLAGG
jgi:hypothetical protein